MTAGAADGDAEFDDIIAWAGASLPVSVERKARLLLLDSVGCIAAGLRHAEVRRLASSLTRWFPGTVRIAGSPPLGPAGAASLAACAMCWDEANDGLARAHGRPSLAVIPALLAIAGEHGLGRVLHALALGYEVGARAGEIWRIGPGMHVDGSWHALGAAAACAWLSGADAGRAVRIAACQIPFSLYRPLALGMTGRNSYAAHGAMLGILCAAAAEAGSDAPPGALAEARRLALRRETPPQRSHAGAWLIEDGYIKPFAGVRHGHYGAAAAIELRRRLGGSESISALRLETYGEALRYAGNRAPQTAIAAQFSLSFAVAAALRFGHLDPAVYDALDDPELTRLESLVQLAEDPLLSRRERRAARLVASTAGGEERVDVDGVLGDPDRPMTDVDVTAKFLRYASTRPDAPAIMEAILRGPLGQPI